MNKRVIGGVSFPWDGHSGPLSLPVSLLVTRFTTVQESFPTSYPDQEWFSTTLSQEWFHWPETWWTEGRALEAGHCGDPFVGGDPAHNNPHLSGRSPTLIQEWTHQHCARYFHLHGFILFSQQPWDGKPRVSQPCKATDLSHAIVMILTQACLASSKTHVLSIVHYCLQNEKTNGAIPFHLGYKQSEVFASFSFHWQR